MQWQHFFLWTFEQRRLSDMSTKVLWTTINREPNIWEANMVFIQILWNFIFGPPIESPGYINCYCSYKGWRNLTTTMKIGHKFRRQNRRQASTYSHRPKHIRKQNFPARNTRNVLLSRFPRSFNGHCALINFIDHEIAEL